MSKQEELRVGIDVIFNKWHYFNTSASSDFLFLSAGQEIVNFLASQGVVIIDKDRELPDNPTKVTPYLGLTVAEAREKNLENNCFVKVIQAHMLKAGYVAVKPLIEVKE